MGKSKTRLFAWSTITAKFVNWSMATPKVGDPGKPSVWRVLKGLESVSTMDGVARGVGREDRASLRIDSQGSGVDAHVDRTLTAVRIKFEDRVSAAGVGEEHAGVRGVRRNRRIENDAGRSARNKTGGNRGAESGSGKTNFHNRQGAGGS